MRDDKTLNECLDEFKLENEMATSTESYYGYVVARLQRYAAKELGIPILRASHLTDSFVNAYLKWLQDTPYKGEPRRPGTVANHRKIIRRLWSWMAEAGHTDSEPKRLRKIKTYWIPPVAWTVEEAGELLQAADDVSGWFNFNGIERRLFWRAFIMVAWDTAFRLSDLLLLDLLDIKDQATIPIIQQKTKFPHVGRLREETWEAVQATFPPVRERVFHWPLSRSSFYKQFGVLVERAGLDGSSKFLRRGSSSYVEAENPGMGAKHLGHKPGSTVAPRNYFDPRITHRNIPLPPAIGGTNG